ncbi:MAG: ATP-binding protein [Polyangiaceae bacterium]
MTVRVGSERRAAPMEVGREARDYLWVRVEDTGEGIAEDVIEHVVRAVLRADVKEPRAGAERVVRDRGGPRGFIDVQSKVGEGAGSRCTCQRTQVEGMRSE